MTVLVEALFVETLLFEDSRRRFSCGVRELKAVERLRLRKMCDVMLPKPFNGTKMNERLPSRIQIEAFQYVHSAGALVTLKATGANFLPARWALI